MMIYGLKSNSTPEIFSETKATCMKTRHSFHIYDFSLLILGFAFFVGGCTAAVPTGKWEVDTGVQRSFEAGTLLPDHTYYYLGSYSRPDTVIAINNQYALRDNHVWAKVDEMSEKVLKGWLNLYRTTGPAAFNYYGGVILAPDGQQAGIWYSKGIINIIRMPEPGVLEVFQPHAMGDFRGKAQSR